MDSANAPDAAALNWLYGRSKIMADRAAMAMGLGDAAAATAILANANTVLHAVQILEKELSASRPADRVKQKAGARQMARPSAPALALVAPQPARDRRRWCEQCDASVMLSAAARCQSRYCKLRAQADAPAQPETASEERDDG